MKKKINLTEKKPEELTEMLAVKREELRHIRFSATGARAKNTSNAKNTRADIARVMTELHARTLVSKKMKNV